MSRALRIYTWIVISVLFQVLVLVFFENFYFNDEAPTPIVVKTDITVVEDKLKVSDDVSDIKSSYNNEYFSFRKGSDTIEVMSIKTKEVYRTIKPEKDISFYKWLPDRNIIIYATSYNSSSSGKVKITTYDVLKGTENSFPEISSLAKDSEVVDLQLSPIIKVVYAKIKTSSKAAKLYRFNIMSQYEFVETIPLDSRIRETNLSDKLLYEEKEKVYIRDGGTNKISALPVKGKLVLLGVDSDDRVFAGQINSKSEIEKIHYGKISKDDDKSFESITVEKPLKAEYIAITRDGTVYGINQEEKTVTNVKTKNTLKYKGELIDVQDKCIIFKADSKINIEPIK